MRPSERFKTSRAGNFQSFTKPQQLMMKSVRAPLSKGPRTRIDVSNPDLSQISYQPRLADRVQSPDLRQTAPQHPRYQSYTSKKRCQTRNARPCPTCKFSQCKCKPRKSSYKPTAEINFSDFQEEKNLEISEQEAGLIPADVPFIPDPNPPLKKGTVYLLESIFEGRPSTVLFNYPPQCLLACRFSDRVKQMEPSELQNMPLSFKISNSVHTYNCVVNSFKYAGFVQTNSKSHNVCITNVPKPESLKQKFPQQKLNHFPGIWQIGRKDLMWRNIFHMKRKHGKHYEICPQTYILPDDYNRVQFQRQQDPKNLWIIKPAASSCGRGIKILHKSSKLKNKHGYIISKYIMNPHTLNGYKYDLRLYVCVTSFDPLRIYMFKDGLVRFATQTYSTNKRTMKKRFIHLTNFSVNKRSNAFVKNKDAGIDGMGSKWSLRALKKQFLAQRIDYDAVFTRIEDVVIKTLISVQPHVVNALNQGNKSRNLCFQVYGFDILLDSSFKPWLLEVNVSPSLSSSSPIDKRIKTSLMCDVFNMIGITPFNRKAVEKQRQNIKNSRLLGIQKPFKALHRNINLLNSVTRLQHYELSEQDQQVLLDFQQEGYRTGQFRRIFPLKENCEFYSQFFEINRYNNLLIRKHLQNETDVLALHYSKRHLNNV